MGRKSNDQKELDFISSVLKKCKRAATADQHNRQEAVSDLKFVNVSQWSEEEKKRRNDKGRPALTINLLPKYVNQVVGDMLHNTPSIKFIPVDSRGDIKLANIRQGIVSSIQYQSAAPEIYDYAAKHLVECGYGAWRVLTRYTEENPFLQEIYLEALKNPLMAFMDPTARSKFYADAKWGLILEKMSRDEFDERYPKAELPGNREMPAQVGLGLEHWYDKDTVTVAEYFERTTETVKMHQLEDGRVVTEDEFGVLKKDWEDRQEELLSRMRMMAVPSPAAPGAPPPGSPPVGPPIPGSPATPPPSPPGQPPVQGAPPAMGGALPPKPPGPPPPSPAMLNGMKMGQELAGHGEEPRIAKSRDTEATVIKHWIMTCAEIVEGGLEGNKVAGKYIPIVLLRGPEVSVEGKTYVTSLIRHAKDPQKLVNYWNCLKLDTPLPTPSGWTTMERVRVGDELFDEKGQPCRVIGVSPINTGRPCFKVTFSDGNSIVTDNTHLWKVEERVKNYTDKYRTRILTTPELDSTRHFVYNSLPLELPDIELPIHPYLLGAWLGNGAAVSGRISIGRTDLTEVMDVYDYFDIPVSGVYKDNSDNYTARITGLTTQLKENRLLNNKHIPSIYLRASKEQRLQLLQGLMDTDGSIDKIFNCSFTTITEGIKEGISELLHSLGIRFSVLKRRGRLEDFKTYVSQGKDFYQLNFTVPIDKQIFRVGRKWDIQKSKDPALAQPRRTTRRKVLKVEEVGSTPTKCVVVSSESHLFLAGKGMIPTHNSSAAETIALAPKSPWLATAAQIEGYEAQYAAANIENTPFLLYNHDPQAGTPTPTRIAPGQPPVAIFEQIRRAEENIKSVIGMFNADVGAPGSEQTGAAVTARQKPGDIGTYEFSKILQGAVEHTGRIINEMIPQIYDSERDVRVRNVDDSDSFVPVNTTVGSAAKAVEENPERYRGMDLPKLRSMMAKDGKDAKFNDLTVGKYDVHVVVGPSYATQRQESAQHLLQLAQSMPNQMGVAADLIVEVMDFKGADELAARLRKPLINQGITKPRAGDPPAQPPPPPPKVQLEQAKAQTVQAQMQYKLQHEQIALEIEKLKYQQELVKAHQLGHVNPLDLHEKALKAEHDKARLGLDVAQFDHKRRMDIINADTNRVKVSGDIMSKMAKVQAQGAPEE